MKIYPRFLRPIGQADGGGAAADVGAGGPSGGERCERLAHAGLRLQPGEPDVGPGFPGRGGGALHGGLGGLPGGEGGRASEYARRHQRAGGRTKGAGWEEGGGGRAAVEGGAPEAARAPRRQPHAHAGLGVQPACGLLAGMPAAGGRRAVEDEGDGTAVPGGPH
eukprot:2903551-Pyramimonas_sp.AAC.1